MKHLMKVRLLIHALLIISFAHIPYISCAAPTGQTTTATSPEKNEQTAWGKYGAKLVRVLGAMGVAAGIYFATRGSGGTIGESAPSYTKYQSYPALFEAAKNGNRTSFEVVRNFNPNERDASENTFLMTAANNGKYSLVSFLLHREDNYKDAQNKNGDTALILAAKANCSDCVRSLIDYEANPILENKQHQTADQLASDSALKDRLATYKKRYQRIHGIR